MRTAIVHPGADKLRYEIREIVDIAKGIEKTGIPITWENIGDPVAKGEAPPSWIKEIVQRAVGEDMTFGYSPTKGLSETREYIAKERNLEGGIQITPDDILFFNGLGDAISHLYRNLHPNARVIGPDPAYPTHSSGEAAHADKPHITYKLDPARDWEPDLKDLEEKIQANPSIAGILLINPGNPAGFVPVPTMKKIVALAREHALFIISDEIYSNLAFKDSGMQKIASVIGDVPAIAMRGVSKEFPWPGARCGWIEFYNRDRDAEFNTYTQSLLNSKMLEVCSTTLPQRVLPSVMSDARYYPYLEKRVAAYERKSDFACKTLSAIPEIIIRKARGAFYMAVVFKDGVLRPDQPLPVSDASQAIIDPFLGSSRLDKQFVYYLLASTGVCVVPLSSGFNSRLHGFRFTLLEQDEKKFQSTVQTIAEAIKKYLAS